MWLFCSNKMSALPYGICKQYSIFLIKKDKTQMLFIGDIRDWENFKSAANNFIKNHSHKLIDINQYKNNVTVGFLKDCYKGKYDFEKLSKNITENNLVDYFYAILLDGFQKNVTDIHIENFHDYFYIKYRIDGILQIQIQIENHLYEKFIRIIKVIAKISVHETDIPQSNVFDINIIDEKANIRVAMHPTIYGQKIVIRILPDRNIPKSLFDLGFDKKDGKVLEKIMQKKQGLVLIVGATGSGKSTTLNSILKTCCNIKSQNIMAIEDPVEYKIDHINKTHVNEKLSYENALQSILRQDPDIIAIGEIRDKKTCDIAFKAALTGHKIIASMHARGLLGTILRLKNLGILDGVYFNIIDAIIYQDLLMVICDLCNGNDPGCNRCKGTRYFGRTVIYDIFDANDIKSFFKNKISPENELDRILNKAKKLIDKNKVEKDQVIKVFG